MSPVLYVICIRSAKNKHTIHIYIYIHTHICHCKRLCVFYFCIVLAPFYKLLYTANTLHSIHQQYNPVSVYCKHATHTDYIPVHTHMIYSPCMNHTPHISPLYITRHAKTSRKHTTPRHWVYKQAYPIHVRKTPCSSYYTTAHPRALPTTHSRNYALDVPRHYIAYNKTIRQPHQPNRHGTRSV